MSPVLALLLVLCLLALDLESLVIVFWKVLVVSSFAASATPAAATTVTFTVSQADPAFVTAHSVVVLETVLSGGLRLRFLLPLQTARGLITVARESIPNYINTVRWHTSRQVSHRRGRGRSDGAVIPVLLLLLLRSGRLEAVALVAVAVARVGRTLA